MAGRAAFITGIRTRAMLVRVALSRTPVLKSFFNPAYVSNLSAWREAFGYSINQWGVHGDSFAAHPLVHRAITVIHDAAAGVPLILSRGQGAGSTPITSGLEFTALNRPSSNLTRAQLIGATAALLDCPMGEAFWLIVRVGEARAIAMLNPEAVDVKQESSGELTYRVTLDNGKQKVLTEDQVIHFKTFNPTNPLRGLGSLAALRNTVVDDLDIGVHNRQMVRNGGIYRPVLETEKQLPEPGSPEDVALQEELKKLLGTPENRGKVVILPDGLKLSAAAVKQSTDMDYLDARKQHVKVIAGATGVTPGKLGDYERDQADAEAQERDFWNDKMVPRLRYIADKIESDMWKISGVSRAARDTGINVAFDFDVVPALVRQKQSTWAGDTQDVTNGIVTINEVRRRRGLPDVAWGNVWWSTGLPSPISSEEAPALPESPAAGEDDPAADTEDDGGKAARIVSLPRIQRSARLQSDPLFVAASIATLQVQVGSQQARAIRELLNDQEQELIAAVRASYKSLIAVPETRAPKDVSEILFDVLEETDRAKRAMRPALRNAVAGGGRQGLRMAKVSRTFSLDARPAIEYMQRQENRFAKGLNEVTYEKLKASLVEGLQRGEGDSQMVARVQAVMETRRAQAQAVAQTQINGAVNGGVELGFRQSEVVKKKQWLHGANPREAHLKAHGQTVLVNEPFIVGGEKLMHPGDPNGSDENVYNCFPASTSVHAYGAQLLFSRSYSGELVTIRTAKGKQLSATPNHPILTDRGWVAIGLLQKGDSVICGALGDSLGAGIPDVKDRPASFDEIQRSLHASPVAGGGELGGRMTQMDFHGDGMDGNVDVVYTDRLLRDRLNAAFPNPLRQLALAGADELPGLLASDGCSEVGIVGEGAAIGGRHALVSVQRGATAVAVASAVAEHAGNDGAREWGAVGDRENGLSGSVSLDDVIDLSRCQFDGHVYNLQVSSGWYLANGIIAKNCNCTIYPVV